MRRRTMLVSAAGLVAAGGCIETMPVDDGDPGGRGEAGGDGEFHETGTIEVLVDGEPVDLSADRFQAEHNPDHDIRFHFHEGDDRWHMEEERVTFAEAIDLIPYFAYERADGDHVVTVDSETYDGREPAIDVEFRVDDDAVDPVEYALQDGDHLVLEVTTEG